MLGGNLAGSTLNGDGATWLFYVIVAALVIILGLSVFVVIAWRQVEGSQGCFLSRRLFSVVERFLRRKPETSRRPTQPSPAAEERSRLRGPQGAEAGPAVMSSYRLTVPTTIITMPDTAPNSTTTTSDGGSPGRLLMNPAEQHLSVDDGH